MVRVAGFTVKELSPKKTSLSSPTVSARTADVTVAEMVESIVGCKWSLHVLALVRRGINRPGAMERSTPGLSAKVLAQRLDKMLRFGILSKQSFPEVPPRVEYALTPFGQQFVEVLEAIERLQQQAPRL